MKIIRTFELKELEAAERYFSGNSVEAPPEYAKEIAAQAIHAMIEDRISLNLQHLPLNEAEQIRKAGLNEGWTEGTKALLEVMTRCFTG